MNKSLNYLLGLSIVLAFASCGDATLVDANHDIHEGVWHVDSLASFNFTVDDASAKYDISYNIRYAAQYPYYNLYVTYYLEDIATNKMIASELQEIILFDKKTGEPLGDGLGDLFDREVLIFENHQFVAAGNYSFKLKQFMRMTELPGIMSFGLKVEEAKQE